jgi:8-oxo-dGTP diphosphatase
VTKEAQLEVAAIAVVAGLIYQGKRLLVCQRKARGPFGLKWEFPGGKVEAGEKSFDALRRELREELGIEVASAREVFRNTHRYGAPPVEIELTFFLVESYRGAATNQVFNEIRWAESERLTTLDFLDGDLPLIDWLLNGGLG